MGNEEGKKAGNDEQRRQVQGGRTGGDVPDIDGVKANIRAAWMAGDFGVVARYSEAEAAAFVDRLSIAPGTRVLDVACGTGNSAIPAARKGAIVTGCDIAPNLLEQARARAAKEGLEIRFEEADAEALPYPAAAFDLVISMFGVMFAPRPDVAAAELVRVCRQGGRIALACWTPDGLMGQMNRAAASYFPPSPLPPPTLWGDEATVRERLGARVSEIRCTRRMHPMVFPFSVAETVEFIRRHVGPFQRAFEGLDAEAQPRLRHDLEALWESHNRATDGTTRAEAEYLEVIAISG
jgi:SAM-dependent methyltransferase